jgi:hypothetical protein
MFDRGKNAKSRAIRSAGILQVFKCGKIAYQCFNAIGGGSATNLRIGIKAREVEQ